MLRDSFELRSFSLFSDFISPKKELEKLLRNGRDMIVHPRNNAMI